ncbi:MAG: hypothetical protein P8N28_05365 [Phycisphaerales bacterium]|nr:hypothetical protein [Phycisphaerales bacterium]
MSVQQDNSTSNTTLWASACIIAALVFVMASRHSRQAVAEGASTANGFTLLTTPDGQGSEQLYVIDQETSMLMVYNLKNPQMNSSMEMVAAWYLPSMFYTAMN